MAVFTEVGFDEAEQLLGRLGLGALRQLEPIVSGIENTNFFLTADAGRFVLTVFERLRAEQLPFYLGLMQHLAQRGLPVPGPRADAAGGLLHRVRGKPAAVVDRLAGAPVLAPSAVHCERVGAVVARLHLAALDFPLRQDNLRGLAWWNEVAPALGPLLEPAQRALLDEELRFQREVAASSSYAALPTGVVHADLFRDNVLFDDATDGEPTLTGVFDFYFAGVDRHAFDLAVCLNDWCTDLATGRLDEERAAALVRGYAARKPLTGEERRLMPAMLRAAALRFWLSRLWDVHRPRDAAVLVPHDPRHFERVLRERIARPWHPLVAGALQ